VLVTHDQAEALMMSDRIALMNQGRVEQIGTADVIYRRPATAFAAEFVGEANVLEAEYLTSGEGAVSVRLQGGLELRIPTAIWPAGATRGLVSIRPEKIHLSETRLSDGNVFEARVDEKVFKGAFDHFMLSTTASTRLIALAPNESARRVPLRAGERVWCAVHAEDIVVIGS
jgi:spermidine/putrescine transport system ATP-binding protein